LSGPVLVMIGHAILATPKSQPCVAAADG
jgi:hypothetical protein